MSDKALDIGGEFGDYRVLRLLGASGNADVYLMRSVTTGQLFSMKIFMPPGGITEETRRRFAEAVNEAMQVRDPNLVRVYDFGEDPETGLFYLVMDYMSGGTLAEHLAMNGPMGVVDALKAAISIARTLDAVHSAGLLHGGLTTDNLLFDEDGALKISGLGIAKASPAPAATGATSISGGISPYMAPEFLLHGSGVDRRADVFSLGVVLMEMLTGVKPAPIPTMVELIVKVTNNDLLPDVRTIRPDTPEVVAKAVARLCAPKSEDRPQTAGEAADLLEAAFKAIGGVADEQPAKRAAAAKPPAKTRIKVQRAAAFAPNMTATLEERGEEGGTGKVVAIIALLLIAIGGAVAALLFRIYRDVDKETPPPEPAAQTQEDVNDPAVRTAVVDGYSWYFTVEHSKAVLWRGVDERHGAPCVDPRPVGRIEVPKKLGGFEVGALGALAFHACRGLTEVVLPETVVSIGNRAFIYCDSLRSLALPPKVKSIGQWALNGCSSLTTVDLANCESIFDEGGLFAFCPSLERISVAPDNPSYRSVDGVLYSADGRRLLAQPATMTSAKIAPGVEEIGAYAFCDSAVRRIEVPKSVVRIGPGAFENCRALKELVFEGDAPQLIPGEDGVFKRASGSLSVAAKKGSLGWPANGDRWPKNDGRKVSLSYAEPTREWRDTHGRARTATLVGITEDRSVIFLCNPGDDKPKSLTVSRLCDEDRRFVAEIAAQLRTYAKRGDSYAPAE